MRISKNKLKGEACIAVVAWPLYNTVHNSSIQISVCLEI